MDELRWMYVESSGDRIKVRVQVQESALCWSSYKDGLLQTVTLKSRQILTSQLDAGNVYRVTVHYVTLANLDAESYILKKQEVTFHGAEDDCKHLADNVKRVVEKNESYRPKRLLVFINPGSGSNRNILDYRSDVEPLLQLCGLSVHAVVTTHANHPAEVLSTYDLTTIDVVVAMGGDGSVSHVVRGLLDKTMSDAGTTLNDDPIKPSVSFAALPGGTGNAVAKSVYSSLDISVCTLAIIMGKTVPYDVLTIHDLDDHKYLASTILSASFGVILNSVMCLESWRWLGRTRYLLILLSLWVNYEHSDLEIEYLPAGDSEVNGNDKDFGARGDIEITDGSKPGWKRFKVQAIGLGILPWAQRDFMCKMKKNNYREPDLSRDKMALRVYTGSYWDLCQAIKNADNLKGPSSWISVFEVSECTIRIHKPGQTEMVIGSDGEMIRLTGNLGFHTKLHTDRLNIMAIDDALVSEAKLYGS